MSPQLIEHRGIVQRVAGGKAIVVMEVSGCAACGQGGSCGIGKMAGGKAATLLTLPACPGLKAGDLVSIGLPQNRLTFAALLGYLFPAFAMLLGAWIGSALDGSDGATALGAIAGFVGALIVARIVIGLIPGLLPAPQIIPVTNPTQLSQQEFSS